MTGNSDNPHTSFPSLTRERRRPTSLSSPVAEFVSTQLKEKNFEGLMELLLDPGLIPSLLTGHILLVDSNPNSSSGIAFRLQKINHTVFEAKTTFEMFEALQHNDVDLLVIAESNLEFLSEAILAFCKNPEHYIPFVVFGSNDNAALIEKAFELGAEDYLVHPVNNALLNIRINAVLQKKAMHTQRLQKLREAQRAMESLHTEMGYFEDGFLLLDTQLKILNHNASLATIYPHLANLKTHKKQEEPLDLTGLSFKDLWQSHLDAEFYDSATQINPHFLKKILELLTHETGTWIEKTKTGETLVIHFQKTFDENILVIIQATNQQGLRPHQLAYLAYYDSLTRTVNRQFFIQHMDHLMSEKGKSPFVVMLLDLDGFKMINDKHGHSVGDWLLKRVAERLKGMLRHGDLVSRIGGDEFTLLITNIDKPELIHQIANRLLNALCAPYKVDDLTLEIGASIGIAQYPKDGKTSGELLKHADKAMYSIKQTGKRGYAFASKDV